MKRPMIPAPKNERQQRFRKVVSTVSAKVADRKLQAISARQAVSDRIGYLIASMLGAGAMHWLGWSGVQALGALYALSVIFALSRMRAATKKS